MGERAGVNVQNSSLATGLFDRMRISVRLVLFSTSQASKVLLNGNPEVTIPGCYANLIRGRPRVDLPGGRRDSDHPIGQFGANANSAGVFPKAIR